MADQRNFTKAYLLSLSKKEPSFLAKDTGFSGTLGARVAKDGQVSLFVGWRQGSKQRKKVLGTVKDLLELDGLTVDDIRERARAVIRKSREGPQDDGTRARMTIAELGKEYIEGRTSGTIKTPYADGGRAAHLALRRAVAVWGDRPVASLRMKDGSALLNQVVKDAVATAKREKRRLGAKYPGHEAAKSARALIKPMLAWLADEVPEVRTELFKQFTAMSNGPHRGVMSKEERILFFHALKIFEKPQSNRTGRRHDVSKDTCDILRLTYLCAARKSDWVQAQWRDVSLGDATWVRPDHKRKQGEEHRQILTQDVISILEGVRGRREQKYRRPVEGEDYIFPSVSKTGKPHRSDLWSAFQTIMDIAGINEGKAEEQRITPHCLRASRITEWVDEHGWSFEKVGLVMGNTEQVVRDVYYRPRHKVEAVRETIEVDGDAALLQGL